METRSLMIDLSESAGKVSAEYIIPEKAKSIITLAHGAGAGMNHSFMVTLAKKLAEQDVA